MSDREQVIEAVLGVRSGIDRIAVSVAEEIADAILALPDSRDAVVEAARALADSAWIEGGDPQRLYDFRALRAALAALDGER